MATAVVEKPRPVIKPNFIADQKRTNPFAHKKGKANTSNNNEDE